MIVERLPEETAITYGHIFKPSSTVLQSSDIKEGEVLLRVHHISVDPTNRIWFAAKTYTDQIQAGDIMKAFGIGEIVESRNARYNPGEIVQGILGWQEYIIVEPKKAKLNHIPLDSPFPSYYLSLMGVNGLTAYFGLKEIGKPKKGDTVIVSSAAGATGSIVCRLAKIWGCKVVGIAGGAEKCNFVRNELKIDGCIDYKNVANLEKEIHRLCPEGVDIYYDNAGETILDAVLANIKDNARVILCGATSTYTNFKGERGLKLVSRIITKRAKIEGFVLYRFQKSFADAVFDLLDMVEAKELWGIETHFKGLEKAPEALDKLFRGENIGKFIIDITDGFQAPKL
eukprot:CAMPEP_0176420354 /NCGR_PEP_ID=MMETSP0127-20121128/8561_1 /TAXON_ID=938130 /ORGANISM="Platyophrya macrostoma, Strain WH" /LENGTH=341 /DNA_ID=CAMNT_0017800943 /DNA_START=114 /DNA_END=1139 /DNA_ORIENTATION=+